jgi:hypothetical protein
VNESQSSEGWTAERVRSLGVRTDLRTAAAVLGIGQTNAYRLAREGTFAVPVVRLGSRYIVPTAGLLAALGLDHEQGRATA